jgi:hypothetical protein
VARLLKIEVGVVHLVGEQPVEELRHLLFIQAGGRQQALFDDLEGVFHGIRVGREGVLGKDMGCPDRF